MRKRLAAVLRTLAARLDSPTVQLRPAMTDFAGSGLTINMYGVDLTSPPPDDLASWAIRRGGCP